jgi:hypothetical protein
LGTLLKMDSLHAPASSAPHFDSAPARKGPSAMTTSDVRFDTRKNGASLLEIATPERRSVLDRVRGLLFGLRIDILQVESIVHDDGIVERFEIVEHDGARISPRRAAAIRSAVRKALQARGKTTRRRGRAA